MCMRAHHLAQGKVSFRFNGKPRAAISLGIGRTSNGVNIFNRFGSFIIQTAAYSKGTFVLYAQAGFCLCHNDVHSSLAVV